MGAEALAAFSALFFGASQVFARRALEDTSTEGVVLITSGMATALLGLAVIPVGVPHMQLSEALIFIAAGLSGSGAGSWASVAGIKRLGATVSVPIHQGARPLMAVLVAVLFLGETLGTSHALGIGAILAGDWFLTSFDPNGRPLQALRQRSVIYSRCWPARHSRPKTYSSDWGVNESSDP